MAERKIVLLGKTGDGKSSAGNTILGKKKFITGCTPKSVTVEPARGEGLVNGRNITVIDTPGFFDTDRDEKEIKSVIIKSLIECAPAVHAFVIILKVGRYTKQEGDVVDIFLKTIEGEDVLKHTVILFTHGDYLKSKTIEEFVKDSPELQELVKKCGGRCHVIDNEYWNKASRGNKSNKVQVKNLLETINKMVEKNGSFSTDLLKHLGKEIQEEMKKNKQEIAKKNVYEKFIVQAAGATTGMLIGAFLGSAVSLVLLSPVCSSKQLLQDTITAGAGFGAGPVIAASVLGATSLIGAAGGVVTGWKAAEEADSVYDAVKKAAKANYENATAVLENTTAVLENIKAMLENTTAVLENIQAVLENTNQLASLL